MNFFSDKKLPEMANAIRFLSADAIEKSKSGPRNAVGHG